MAWGWRGGGGGWAGPWPGRGPFSYLPPWQRPGWLFGFGRGFARGWWWGANPYVCARFPWLPRWWWTTQQYRLPYAGYGPGYWYGFTGIPWSFYPYPYAANPYGYSPSPYTAYW